MGELKVSAVAALAVTLLAVVIAVTLSMSSFRYQSEVKELRTMNAEYRQTLSEYRQALKEIKRHLSRVEGNI